MTDQIRRNQSDGPYLWLSKDAHERALQAAGTNGLVAYIALCRLESNAPEQFKQSFSASRDNIAHYSGLSARTVANILPVLVKARIISIQSGRHAGPQRSHQANKFTILSLKRFQTEFAEAPCAISGANNCSQKRTFFPKGKRKFVEQPRSSAQEPKGPGFTTAASSTVPTFKG